MTLSNGNGTVESGDILMKLELVFHIKKNEQDEFLTYFPEFRDVFNDILTGVESFIEKQAEALTMVSAMEFESRKELAEVVKLTPCPACIFALIDGKTQSPRDWLLSRPTDKVLDYIGVV